MNNNITPKFVRMSMINRQDTGPVGISPEDTFDFVFTLTSNTSKNVKEQVSAKISEIMESKSSGNSATIKVSITMKNGSRSDLFLEVEGSSKEDIVQTKTYNPTRNGLTSQFIKGEIGFKNQVMGLITDQLESQSTTEKVARLKENNPTINNQLLTMIANGEKIDWQNMPLTPHINSGDSGSLTPINGIIETVKRAGGEDESSLTQERIKNKEKNNNQFWGENVSFQALTQLRDMLSDQNIDIDVINTYFPKKPTDDMKQKMKTLAIIIQSPVLKELLPKNISTLIFPDKSKPNTKSLNSRAKTMAAAMMLLIEDKRQQLVTTAGIDNLPKSQDLVKQTQILKKPFEPIIKGIKELFDLT
jgi:hypothetical protein